MRRGRLPSVHSRAQHTFASAPQANIPRSAFDRTFTHKSAFNAGFLIPIMADEMLPGDTFKLSLQAFLRMSTPIFPLMDNLHFETFFFAVPNRLLWENWERFNGAQDNPGDSTDYLVPQIVSPAVTGFDALSIYDYFGLKPGVPGFSINALHLRAYNKVFNDWFRDENLQDSLDVPVDDGPDLATTYQLVRRGKRKDYFTSALPWPQKGPAVTLPLGTTAPIMGNTLPTTVYGSGYPASVGFLSMNTAPPGSQRTLYSISAGTQSTNANLLFSTNPTQVGLVADLSEATAASINDIRTAFQIQKLLERDARGGTRYVELIESHFHVTSPDFRLQRSEYIGGGYAPVIITPIAQTSPTTGDNALGDLAAYGTIAPRGHGFIYSATEHMVIIGLACIRADLTYQDGIDRMWSRQTRYDYYWPAFSHLGEQAVLNKEIYVQGISADDEVFGYQERHAEYRYKPSIITGPMRSDYPQSLDPWHLSEDFATLPVLNDEFIEVNPPMERVLAVPDEPQFIFDSVFQYRCVRPMPVFSVPGYVDHF